jgi:hypothetical protein
VRASGNNFLKKGYEVKRRQGRVERKCKLGMEILKREAGKGKARKCR